MNGILLLISLNYLLFTFSPLFAFKPLFEDNNNTSSPPLQMQSLSFNPVTEITFESMWEFKLFNGVFVASIMLCWSTCKSFTTSFRCLLRTRTLVMVLQVVVWSLASFPTCLLHWIALEDLFPWQDLQACLQYTQKQTHAWPPHTNTHTLWKKEKEKLGKCCLENVLLLLAQKFQVFDLLPKNQILKPLQMKKTKIAYLLTCLCLPLTTCLPLLTCSLKT